MDFSGFLTLVAVMISALTLTSKGRQVVYLHKFGVAHLFVMTLSSLVVLYCLFYKTLQANGLLLPFNFINGFDESQLLLLTSLLMMIFCIRQITMGATSKSRLKSLCQNMCNLLDNGEYSELIYILKENKVFFSQSDIINRDETKKMVRKLILSKRFSSHLHDLDLELFLYLLNIYANSDVAEAEFSGYISEQLKHPKSYIVKETLYLISSYSPRIPDDNTPILKILYEKLDEPLKYELYEKVSEYTIELARKQEILLNSSPHDVISDHEIRNNPVFLYSFLFFNLLKSDIRNSTRFINGSSSLPCHYLFSKICLVELIELRKCEPDSQETNEFKTRIDYLLYDIFRTYRDIISMNEINNLDSNSLYSLVENFAYSFFRFYSSDKFDSELKTYILSFYVDIYRIIKDINPNLSNSFAYLCVRSHENSNKELDLDIENIDLKKMHLAEELKIASNNKSIE